MSCEETQQTASHHAKRVNKEGVFTNKRGSNVKPACDHLCKDCMDKIIQNHQPKLLAYPSNEKIVLPGKLDNKYSKSPYETVQNHKMLKEYFSVEMAGTNPSKTSHPLEHNYRTVRQM